MARPLLRLADLAGKFAVVTGASAGVGQGIALALLQQGAHVFGVDVSSTFPPLAAQSADSGRYVHLQCDLRSPDEIVGTCGAVAAQTAGSLDYLVNCAGIDPKFTMAEGGPEQWASVVDVNLRAPYLMVRSALPLLERGHGKSIVNISSINYRLGVPRRAIYSASKAGILGLTTNLARTLGPAGIRVNTVTPGWVWTERERKLYFEGAKADELIAGLMEKQSTRHRISPEDIANHVLFYLSAVSAASTGHNCVVDAGWLLE